MIRSNTPSLRLFVVRHGETAANTEMRYLGNRDDPLTAQGAWQAKQLARPLALSRIESIYCSPLRRARETAEPAARACGMELRLDARLREAAFGSWEGLSRQEVLARSPEDAELLKSWESDPACAPPGGESLRDVRERILSLVEELADLSTGGPVVLVSHVGPIKALLTTALGVPLAASRRLFLDPATISVIDWGPTPLIRLFNSHEHMGWKSARWF